jgi:hypothetical protein
MLLTMDNKGTVDLANNWSIGGCTRHVYVQQFPAGTQRVQSDVH